MIDHLSSKFASTYTPHCETAVDEAMTKFQGRSSLKQYMPMKPVKRGIKVWVLGDSHNGYFSRFDIYTGKGASPEKGLGARVVKSLTEPLKNKFHHVYFDNFFTSEQLLTDLEKDGIYGCGTARKDRRGFPDALKKPKLKERYIHKHCYTKQSEVGFTMHTTPLFTCLLHLNTLTLILISHTYMYDRIQLCAYS